MSKPTQSKAQRTPRQCLFCENPAGSAEHVWSKWMSKHFARTSHDKSIEYWDRLGGHNVELPEPRIVHGHAVTTKVKGVCKQCNHGWMSGVETAVKPFLEPMLLGRSVTLSPAAQRAVTEWIVLKMMVWELTLPTTAVFRRDQTLEFARTRAIPDNIRIWLFRSLDPGRHARITRAFSGLFPLDQVPCVIPKEPNTQTALFRIGKLIAFFVHSHLPELELGKFRQVDAKVLWPPRGRVLSWPPLNSISWAASDHIANTLGRFLGRPGMIPI